MKLGNRATRLIAVVTVGALVAACGSSNSSPSASTAASPTTGATSSVAGATSSASGVTSGAPVTLTWFSNSVVGGKNNNGATWATKYVIPTFEQMEKAKGVNVTVKFDGTGVADAQYESQLALDLKSGGTPDVFDIDGIWVGEFAQAGYIKPLTQVVGSSVNSWSGWSQITPAVQSNLSFKGQRYGIPSGTDGRFIYLNKDVLKAAGLPSSWQPKSWQDILTAAQQIKAKDPGVTPIQIDAGVPMGEATSLQGFQMLLAGTGKLVQDQNTGKWLAGTSPQVKDVLNFYNQVYSNGLGNKQWQLAANGRDLSFQAFSKKKVGMLIESDYVWRSVINPNGGIDPMPDRNSEVGWAFMPAMKPGSGIRGQNYVSMSGGTGWSMNPKTAHPQVAWDFLQFLGSKQATLQKAQKTVSITERNDVNKQVLANDPLLTFVSQKVLPLTAYRPSSGLYPQVSMVLQKATQDIVTGQSVSQAASDYQNMLVNIVGSSNVYGGS